MIYRLDKYLTEAQAGSRSEVKDLIRKGRVSVNGQIIKKPETKVNTDTDEIICAGKKILLAGLCYYMLNKPAGYVSSTDAHDGATILELMKDAPGRDLFPAGRLDKDTEGFLLVTNDGDLSHRLLSPKKHVDKIYYAKLKHALTLQERKLLENGVDIGDEKKTLPSLIFLPGAEDNNEFWNPVADRLMELIEAVDDPNEDPFIFILIREGRYHQIKRMLEAVDNEVVYLKRLAYGAVLLDGSLKSGEYRTLKAEELQSLQKGENFCGE